VGDGEKRHLKQKRWQILTEKKQAQDEQQVIHSERQNMPESTDKIGPDHRREGVENHQETKDDGKHASRVIRGIGDRRKG